jgi:ribosomal protein L16 Arg81 hydroxylase
MSAFPIEELFTPLSIGEFMATHWEKQFIITPGESSRFQEIFAWADLQGLLENHSHGALGLTITRSGVTVPEHEITDVVAMRGRRTTRVNTSSLMQILAAGATLKLSCIDERLPKLRSLADQMESVFQAQVHCDITAAIREFPHFRPSYDPFDKIILQIAGRTMWHLFGSSVLSPLAGNSPSEKPSGSQVWDGHLEAGSMLYIPRGYWHTASTASDASMYIAMGIYSLTGLDFLWWVLEQATASLAVRSSVPATSGRDRDEYFGRLRQVVLKLMSPEIAERFFTELGPQAHPRPRIDFVADLKISCSTDDHQNG